MRPQPEPNCSGLSVSQQSMWLREDSLLCVVAKPRVDFDAFDQPSLPSLLASLLPPGLGLADRSCALLGPRVLAGVSANDAAFSNEAVERRASPRNVAAAGP